jgi:hypothetical protein
MAFMSILMGYNVPSDYCVPDASVKTEAFSDAATRPAG